MEPIDILDQLPLEQSALRVIKLHHSQNLKTKI